MLIAEQMCVPLSKLEIAVLLIGNSEGIMIFDGVHFAPIRINNSTDTAMNL